MKEVSDEAKALRHILKQGLAVHPTWSGYVLGTFYSNGAFGRHGKEHKTPDEAIDAAVLWAIAKRDEKTPRSPQGPSPSTQPVTDGGRGDDERGDDERT